MMKWWTIGEEKAKLIQDKIAQKHVDEHPVSNNQVIIAGSGKQLCYDGISGRYFESDIQTIRAAVNTINETMVYEMYASLGDFYNEMGLPPTTLSDELGWNLDDGPWNQLWISHIRWRTTVYHSTDLSCSTEIRFCQTRIIRVIYIVFNEKSNTIQEETKMEETKSTENFDEVLDENEKKLKLRNRLKNQNSKWQKTKSRYWITTVLKAVAVGAGLVAAYTLGSRHEMRIAVAENDYVELEVFWGFWRI